MKASMTDLKTPSVSSLERGLAVIEILAKSENGMGLTSLARSIGVPKSSTHCLLLTLERSGYLERHEKSGRYIFSPKLLSLASVPMASLKLREIVKPYLLTLMQGTGLTIHLAVRDRGEAVLIEKIDPPGPRKSATWVGKRLEVHCTSIGKAVIAYCSAEELDGLISHHPLVRHNDNTIVSIKKLKEELKSIRKNGYAVDDEEEEVGMRCVGSPLFDHTGVIGAISACGTIGQVAPENLISIAGKVRQTAEIISQHFGYESAVTSA